MIDIGWLFSCGKTFLHFAEALNDQDRDAVNDTDFVKYILDVFWKKYQIKIVLRIFLPYILYAILTFVYLVEIINNDAYKERDARMIVIGLIICVLLAYMLLTEAF